MKESVFEFHDGVPESLEEELYSINPFGYAVEVDSNGSRLRVYDEKVEMFLRSEGFEPSEVFYTDPTNWFENTIKKPFELVEGVIVDPWGEYDGDGIVLRIEPGMAFGTGLHPTTRMCAEFISKYVKAGVNLLDVGTGTGILAILAKKLGAEHVVAVDCDETALEIAKENALKNEVDIEIVKSDLLSEVTGEFDIVVANIVPNVLLKLSEEVERVMKPDGVLILSGLDVQSEVNVLRSYTRLSFEILDRKVEGDWVSLVLRSSKDSLVEE